MSGENGDIASEEQRKKLEALKKKAKEKGFSIEREGDNVKVALDSDVLIKSKEFDRQRDKLVSRLAEYGHLVEGVEELRTIDDLRGLAGTLSDLEKQAQKSGEKRGGAGTAPLSSEGGSSDLESKSYASIEELISDLHRHEDAKSHSSDEASRILNEITKKAFEGRRKLDRPTNFSIDPKDESGKRIPYKELFNQEARKRELLRRKLEREARENE